MINKKSVREFYALLEKSINDALLDNDRYKDVTSRRDNKLELLESSYSANDFDLLQEYLEIEGKILSIQMEEAFVTGFSTAYKLIIDSLQ